MVPWWHDEVVTCSVDLYSFLGMQSVGDVVSK